MYWVDFENYILEKAQYKLGLLPVILLMALVAIVFMPGFVWAQSSSDIDNRLRRMENEISTLSRAVYKGETPPPGAFSATNSGADTEIRIQQLETDIRDLRGKIEEQTYQVQQMRSELGRISTDMDLRMREMEGIKSSTPSSNVTPQSYQQGQTFTYSDNAPPGSIAETGNLTSDNNYSWGTNNSNSISSSTQGQLGSIGSAAGTTSAAAQYEQAFSLLKNNQHDQAQVEFRSFLEAFPNHDLAGNAQYWLGETYYVRGKYEEATRIFAEGYKKYPKSAKSADNLLKLGLSLDALGKKNEACIALRQLTKENTVGSAPVLRRAEQELSRLDC